MKYFRNSSLSICLLILAVMLIIQCSSEVNKQQAVEMIKARTMGLAYIEENKLQEAEASFSKLVEIAPKEALGYANLGLVYFRMGKFEQAELNFKHALEIEPKNPEIKLNYAELFLLTDRDSLAVELLEESIRFNPDHIRTLYKLGQIYARSNDGQKRNRSESYLTKVISFLPTNISVRLELIDLLLKEEKADTAAANFEKLRSQMPEFPEGADEFYNKALNFMLKNNSKEAIVPFNIFRNILRPTPLYQAGSDELKGAGGPLIGTPLITFSQDNTVNVESEQAVLEAMRFTDVTDAAGLNILPISGRAAYIMATADFDGNRTVDLYASVWNEQENKNNTYLLKNDFGKYVNIAAQAGIEHNGKDINAIFADYDNDGYLDLFVVNNKENILYHHFKAQRFRNVSEAAAIKINGYGNAACFADFDHDGDLDIYLAAQSRNAFFRNNLDGSFRESSEKMAISGIETPSKDIAYADFDDDGDLDLFVLNPDTSNTMYSNLRQGRFADVTSEWGLSSDSGSTALATGDYNNDGLMDIFITNSGNSGYSLFTNRDGKTYDLDYRSNEMKEILQNYTCSDVHFVDFDNDGFLDVAIAGKHKVDSFKKQGLLLFHNDGTGVFSDASHLLAQGMPAGSQIAIADYNEDGDQDIFFSSEDGRVHLLRNDGGNANRYLKIQLVGLRTGSGKNNYFGIGTKVEVKAGELYQSSTVTEPVIHFGMGQKSEADVVRVMWTNGVPQNILKPGSDQAILEEQILKGSCPFLYAWNGEKYEFVTDVLWRSALGMPLGIMGGETAYAFSDPSQDYFKIPGEMLKEKDGYYSIKLTTELWETAYFDQVELLVVDHLDSTDIYMDERFLPPPYPPLKIHQVSNKLYPESVIDDRGNDLTEITRYRDDVYISNFNSERYQGITKAHDIIIDLGDLSGSEHVNLYLNGWVFPTDASINIAVSQSSNNLIYPPGLQVKDKQGKWQTVIDNISFPMGKNKTVILDLTGKFLSKNYQVRIRTSMQIYWDHIFYSLGQSNSPLKVNKLDPAMADFQYRGFSRMFRKGGRYGPFWFDYDHVSTDPKWRDLEGYYTRYGAVKELLLESDSKYIISNAGDEISLKFDVSETPELPPGWSRDFIIYTSGWLKDGDLNTARGQTVGPLPFIGMSKYPYGKNEHYPKDEEHKKFLEEYVTRKVTTDNYKKLIIN